MKQSKHRTAKLVRDYLIIFVIGAVLLYPIIWMLFASFKSNDEIFGSIPVSYTHLRAHET